MTTDKKELAHERAARLAIKIGNRPTKSMSTGEAKSLMESVASLGGREAGSPLSEESCRSPVALTELRRGDVFIAKVTGGKVRPWVVLGVIGEHVSAVTMSSKDSAPAVVKTKCRFWPDCWIGTTVSLFDVEYAAREVTRPYTNLAHLREIEQSIARNFTRTPAVASMSDIRRRIFSQEMEGTV